MSIQMFIDGGYVEEITKADRYRRGDTRQINLNYGEFRDAALGRFSLSKSDLVAVFYYHAKPRDAKAATGKERLFTALREQHHFTVREGIVSSKRCRGFDKCGVTKDHQKQVDTKMTIDMLRAIWLDDSVTDLIMVTGDSDFVPLLDEASLYSKNLYTFHGPATITADKLINHAGPGYVASEFTRADLIALSGSTTRVVGK